MMNERRQQFPDGVQKNDSEAISRLETYGIGDYDFALTVESEINKDASGNEVDLARDADITWIKFNKPDDGDFSDLESVEGKLYIPKNNGNGELIFFTPGFPGGNAGRFEKQYAKAFVDAGYSFFTIRHNGSSLTKIDSAKEVVNFDKRLELAKQSGEDYIGGTKENGHAPAEIVNEPITPLLQLCKMFDKVHLMGQSMGVTSSYNAVTRLSGRPDITDKIGNIVGIAGYVGKEKGEPEDPWGGMKMPTKDLVEYEKEYIKQVDTNTIFTEDEVAKLVEVNKKMKVPSHIGNILIVSPGDPLIGGPDKTKEDYANKYGPETGKKLIISDESNLDKPKQHSMLWIAPKNLLRAVKAEISVHGPHYIKLPNKTEGGLVEKG